jgi:hypothetical protein
MIISFAWTTEALINGHKTVTRRFWHDKTAKACSPGTVHQAWDKNPRFKGKRIGFVKIKNIYKQKLSQMTEDDLIAEGNRYRYWKNLAEFVEMMGGPEAEPWVIEFEFQKEPLSANGVDLGQPT